MKARMKRWIALWTAMIMILIPYVETMGAELGQTSVALEEIADEEDSRNSLSPDADVQPVRVEDVYINPIYRDVVQESDLKQPSEEQPEISPYSEVEYADTVEEAGLQIREGMKQRHETIVVYYQAPEYEDGVMREIAAQALIHTGEPTEGDYLRWQYGGWQAEGELRSSSDGTVTYMTFTYTYTYYTTYEQETLVDEQIDRVLDELDVYKSGTYQKIKAVYDYICQNTSYDYDNLNNEDYKLKYTAYAALIDGKAVCQGYALLFYRMSLELGVNSRLISGTGNQEAHGWNIVNVNGLYYNVDTTWDAGRMEYDYFLKCDQNFVDHVRDEEYTTQEFYVSYPMAKEDYAPVYVEKLETPEIISVYSKIQTSAKVTWTVVNGAQGYELFRAETLDAPEEEWILTKTIRNGSGGEYTNTGLTPGKTYYYRVRAFAVNDNDAYIYSEFSDVNYMPAAVQFDGPYSNSSDRIRIRWNQVEGAHGYQIWRQNEDGTFRIVKIVGAREDIPSLTQCEDTAYSNTGLEAGKTYTYRMRAYAFLNGTVVYGAYSGDISVAVMPEMPELMADSPKEGRAVLSWNQVNGVDGYQLWRSEDTKEGYSIVKVINEKGVTSYTNTGLESGKTYFYKVRAYIEINGHSTFGEYSEPISVRVR